MAPPPDTKVPQEDGRLGPDELAAEFLDRMAQGAQPDVRDYLDRLSTLDGRRELLELLRFAVKVQDVVPVAIAAGDRVGQYELTEELDSGGMGRVFLAFDLLLEREVAVKVLLPTITDREFRRRFNEECKFLAKLNHPNIVAVHDAGFHGNVSYLVMDRVQGRSMFAVIGELAKVPASPLSGELLGQIIDRPVSSGRGSLLERDWCRTVARVLRAAVSAVEAAHAQNILHRDINPRNIMLIGGGHPILLDFGLAGSADVTDEFHEKLLGTVSYLAPEQIGEGRMGAEKATDIYQLGLVLYEMLTLRKAFPGETAAEVTVNIQNTSYDWPRAVRPEVPRDLEAICLKAMERDPRRRYVSAALMGTDLDHFLEGLPTVARPPGLLRRVQLKARRHRLVAAVMVALVLGLGGGAWWNLRDLPETPPLLLRLEQGATQFIPCLDKVRGGDYLAVEIDVAGPARMRVLSITGPEEGAPRYVHPLVPLRREEIEAGNLDQPFHREVGNDGKEIWWLSKIANQGPEGSERWSEMLWVFLFRDEESPVVQRFMGRLEMWEKNYREIGEPIPYDRARDQLNGLLVSGRGDPLTEVDQQGLLSAVNILQGDPVREEWPFDDPVFYQWRFSAAAPEKVGGALPDGGETNR